jgi:hypothetical protein
LNDSSPTTDRTIPWSHIAKGALKVSRARTIINKLHVDSRLQREYGVYRDHTTYDDGTSQTNNGTFSYNAKWEGLAGTAATHVAEFLVKNPDGIWSQQHNTIEFETVLNTNVDLEIGDWIELDDTTVDPHVLCYGTSWSGKQFLVIGITQLMASTKIRAIELYD